MGKETKETLKIDNFLSISHIEWEFGRFNIITGDMGSGKSLCIKLLKFFEDIISNLLILPYEVFRENLDTRTFFNHLINEFTDIFVFLTTAPAKQPEFEIKYAFSYNDVTFDVTVKGKNEVDITFESVYLKNMLKEWDEYSQKRGIFNSENVTPDGFAEAKMSFYSEVLKKFGGYFPMATTFVPASRAALAFTSNPNDNYLKKYKELTDVFPRFGSRDQEKINTILKAKIRIEGNYLYLVSDDGRKVPISKASSGQQEIVYVLMLLDRLGYFRYSYGNHHSIFIEEPEAHLFPLEQKQTIDLIVQMFNLLKGNGNPVRFFITTHSPYILNCLNNILKKGALLNEYKDQADKINEAIDFPHLFADEISAYSIDSQGKGDNMLDEDGKYLYSEKIADISKGINEDTLKLRELNNELLDEEE